MEALEQVKNQRAWDKLPLVKSSLQDFSRVVADAKSRIMALQRQGIQNRGLPKFVVVVFVLKRSKIRPDQAHT